ncbi:MAG TPA: hypothetical protein VK463_01225 [Desulfomonilaceae bacterium]|nr:hypothetical protein [Desulfomonilaceae bacterium]
MSRRCVAAAFAVLMVLATVSLSHAGASCCDPANQAGTPQGNRIQAGILSPAQNPGTAAAANKPGSQSITAYMGYAGAKTNPQSNAGSGASCCPSPNASNQAGENTPPEQQLGNPGCRCGGGGCGAFSGGQSVQAIGQYQGMLAAPVAPVVQAISPVASPSPAMTAIPVKASTKNKSIGSRTLW